MTNKSSSKQHCLVGNIRPKSKMRKRKNKAGAKVRRDARTCPADLLNAVDKKPSKTKKTSKSKKDEGAKKDDKTAKKTETPKKTTEKED